MSSLVQVEILENLTGVEITEFAMQGIPGPPGPAGTGAVTVVNFAWGDASPALMVTVAANKRVWDVRVFIETPFNGASPALTVGSIAGPAELMAANENGPGSMGVYETYPNKKYGTSTLIYLTITPGAGASAGAGQVHFEIEP